jgi:glycerol kinase
LYGWDITKPETLAHLNTRGAREFEPQLAEQEREEQWKNWQRAVERSLGWDEAPDE